MPHTLLKGKGKGVVKKLANPLNTLMPWRLFKRKKRKNRYDGFDGENSLTAEISAFDAAIERFADENEVPSKAVAIDMINAHKNELKNYLLSKGIQPSGNNPVLLAAQVAGLREALAQRLAGDSFDGDIEQGYHALNYMEGEAFNGDSGEPDNIWGALLSAVGKVGKGALNKINQNRANKGKGGLFSDLFKSKKKKIMK